MTRRIVPDVVNEQTLSMLAPGDTVLKAAEIMATRKIGAVLVMEADRLVGIVTERDITTRVVARARSARETAIADVMTPDPETISPKETVMDALQRMQAGGFRHLPVVEGGKVMGIVSIRDIYAAVRDDLEEAVLEREAFISGSGMAGLP